MAPGAAPVDFSSPIGEFRLLANDTVYSNAVGGVGQFALFSDAEIETYIRLYPNMLRAVGYGYLGLAARAAMEAKNVKDYDLQADLTKRAAELRSTARAYFERADAEADLIGTESTFGIDEPSPFRHTRFEPTDRDVLGWGLF